MKILKSPETAQAFSAQGVEPAWTTPKELEAYMKAETGRWRKVIQTAGIKLE